MIQELFVNQLTNLRSKQRHQQKVTQSEKKHYKSNRRTESLNCVCKKFRVETTGD